MASENDSHWLEEQMGRLSYVVDRGDEGVSGEDAVPVLEPKVYSE